ncbi:MAG: EamA family transporter [Alphaproteobacteria bacterium]|nr:EamA family transporter [Alphaproteobacteria bacterium]
MLKYITHKGIVFAVCAAILFGISTPLAKLLIHGISPMILAGLLYLGSGSGLALWIIIKKIIFPTNINTEAKLSFIDIPWLIGAIITGGAIAPLLLMVGLIYISASHASLLLNFEGTATTMLAWFVFKENFDRRIFIGMILIVMGGMLLSWQEINGFNFPMGSLLVVGACFFWGIDNNLTRKISASDPVQIACIKGLIAGGINLSIGFMFDYNLPNLSLSIKTALLGLFSYGISLVMFVLALRHLGTARTGAYFSMAPFVGAALSLILTQENPTLIFWLAVLCMGIGIGLHLIEHHEHEHIHEAIGHAHKHTHDIHHQHKHDFVWNSTKPHTHFHNHEPTNHNHVHYPDIHHRHKHEK